MLVPVPADPDLGRGGVDGDGDPAIEAAADRDDSPAVDVVRHPGSRRTHRRTANRRARRLRGRSARVARQRARPRPYPHPERGLPAPQCVAQGRRTRLRGRFHAPGNRPADVPDLGRARAQAAARRPLARPARRAGEGVTCPASTSAAILLSTAGLALLDARWRLAAWRSPVQTAVAIAIGTAVLPRVGCGGHRDGRVREGRRARSSSASISPRSCRSKSRSSWRSCATRRWSRGPLRCG